MANLAGNFVGVLFTSRTVAHQLHLKTKSYAEHKALQTFYEDIIDLVDGFAEQYQGRHEELLTIPAYTTKEPDDPLKYFKTTVAWIEDNRDKIVPLKETSLQNTIDEVLALFYSTIYKLKFLK